MKSKLARQILCIVSGLFVTSLLVQGQTDRFADRTTIGFWEVGPGVMLAPGIEVRQNGIGGRIIKGDAAFIGGTSSSSPPAIFMRPTM